MGNEIVIGNEEEGMPKELWVDGVETKTDDADRPSDLPMPFTRRWKQEANV